jgi:hypothetical protein
VPLVASLVATPTSHLNGGSNAFDASVAKIEPGTVVDTAFAAGRPFLAYASAVNAAPVMMNGAASGNTNGSIDGVSEDIPIMYNGLASDRAILTGQICIVAAVGAFSRQGDSGALVCTPDLHPLGLIAGGSSSQADAPIAHSFASPIGPILDFYQVSIQP